MTDFSDRQKGEEGKFAMDADTAFRVAARRNRLLGHWAAEKMGLTAEETDAYAKAVVQADFEEAGDEIEALVDDGDHYLARVRSAAFAGKNRVQQHKMVYEALGGRMGGELHALQLQTGVPN